jgi:single-stranded DNA-binding protein
MTAKGIDPFPDYLDANNCHGFTHHVIVGRIGHLWLSDLEKSQVINCRVAVCPWLKRETQTTVVWYEVSLWENQAHAFEKLNFKVGDLILFRLDNIRAHAWVDSDGAIKTTIKGAADKFMDLRPTAIDLRHALRAMNQNEPKPAETAGPQAGPASGPPSGSPAPSEAEPEPNPKDPSPKF